MEYKHLPKESGVYRITNVVTSEIYIGGSVNIRNRCSKHVGDLKRGVHHSKYLQRSFNIHGEDSFVIDCMVICEESEILKFEELYIQDLKPAYNSVMTPTNPGKHFKTKDNRYSESLKARWQDPAYAEKQRKALNEALKTDKFREKQREGSIAAHKKNPQQAEDHSKLMQTLLKDPDYKKNQSEGTKKAMRTPEIRDKVKKAKGMLEDDQVIEVLKLLKEGLIHRVIAEMIGKTIYVVNDISSGKSYKHINRETLEVDPDFYTT